MPLAIVTGVAAPEQVGAALARRLAADGWALALLGRDAAAVEARAAELRAAGHDATAHVVDLADPAAVARVAAHLDTAAAEGVGALVATAGGFASDGPVADADPALLERVLRTNLATAFVTTHAFLPALRRGRGALVYFASTAVLPGASGAGMAAYAAAKAGVLALMRAVAAEEAAHGVRAHALAPAAIRTGANERAMGDAGPFVERETVEDVVAWLCGPAARGVTGQVVELRATR